MSLPNLVIAGAPKCGTSSLFHWLADHPQASGSTVKETFYLMDEGHPLRRTDANYQTNGLDGYEKYFANCSAQHRIIFEATTHYIYQRTALEVLSQLRPKPQIVFLLRKPSERVYSSFQYSKNNLATISGDVSFSQFITLVKSQRDTALIKEHAGTGAYVLKNDISYSRYVDYIRLWIERFGRDHIHVLLFEEMKRDPRAFMRDMAGRIGIDKTFYDDYEFPVKNETVHLKYLLVHRQIRKLNGMMPSGKLKALLKRLYLRAQSYRYVGGMTSEDRGTLSELEREFQPFNQRLTNELGIDLSMWNCQC